MNLKLYAGIALLICSVVMSSCAKDPTLDPDVPDASTVPVHPDPTAQLSVVPKAPLNMARVAQVAQMLQPAPKGFGPTYKDRAAWNAAYASGRYSSIISTANDYNKKTLEPWDPSWEDLYFDVAGNNDSQTGKTLLTERLKYLTYATWAECLLNDGSYIAKLEDVMVKLVTQKIWANPRNYVKGRKVQDIELSAASYGPNLAQALYMLDDKISPAVRQQVIDTLYARVLDPMMNTFIPVVTGNNTWLTGINNWNPVCLSGVVSTALTIVPGIEDRAKYITIAERYVQNYAVGFPADGYCTEGMSYYNYGYSHYIMLREKIAQATGGRIDIFRNDPRLRKSAVYALNMQMFADISPNENFYAAIADCPVNARPSSRILYYMSRILNISIPAYDNFQRYATTVDLDEGSLFAFTNSTDMGFHGSSSGAVNEYRSEFEYTGLLIVRPAPNASFRMAATLKGGNNAEQHNHNDIGSYTMLVNNQALVEDPGNTPYTGDTFGPNRYNNKTLSSYGHPVPRINETEQIEGSGTDAVVLDKSFSDARDVYKLDISKAYKNISGINKLTREFIFTRGSDAGLEVKDEFEFASPYKFETAISTRATWILSGNTINLTRTTSTGSTVNRGTGSCKATIEASGPYTITSEEITDATVAYTRIAITLDDPATSGYINIKYTEN